MVSRNLTLHQARNAVACGHGNYIRFVPWAKASRYGYLLLPDGNLVYYEGEKVIDSFVQFPLVHHGNDWTVTETI